MIRKILIVSDSHSKSQNIKAAIDREQPDMLIHLGDIEDDPETVREWLDAAARKFNSKTDDASKIKRLPIPAVFIQGNCDRYGANYNLKKTAVFELNDHRFFCVHGHVQGVSYGIENLMYSAMENDCDIALYGHTHIPFDETFEGFGDTVGSGVRIMNPGSISLPRARTPKSYMVMTFNEDGSDYVVELKNL